jgi:histidinol-phosphatase (PHP family)
MTPVNFRKACESVRLVSVHGGHSGEFCTHARDRLEDIVATYIKRGFSWVGITEHMPPAEDRFRYPDEIECGLSAEDLYRRFSCYFKTCRSLQARYAPTIRICVGFETETYTGSLPFVRHLMETFTPDYVVGSVHHVNDINFDFDEAHYRQAARAAGDVDGLYLRYFDLQYEMLAALKPAVVGHFDLIRLHDPDYRSRLEKPAIRKKIRRNLQLIQSEGLILDLNMRALTKGSSEPYVSGTILREALGMGLRVIPGDDSHGVATAGFGIEEGIALLTRFGFDTNWALPA